MSCKPVHHIPSCPIGGRCSGGNTCCCPVTYKALLTITVHSKHEGSVWHQWGCLCKELCLLGQCLLCTELTMLAAEIFPSWEHVSCPCFFFLNWYEKTSSIKTPIPPNANWAMSKECHSFAAGGSTSAPTEVVTCKNRFSQKMSVEAVTHAMKILIRWYWRAVWPCDHDANFRVFRAPTCSEVLVITINFFLRFRK